MAIQQLMKLTGHNASIFALSQGREDHYFLSAAGDGWIVQWDMRSLGPGQLVARVGVQVFVLHFLKKINVAVAGDMNGGMHWVSLGDPAASKDIAHHKKGVYALQEANDYLFSAGGDGRLTRWAAEEFRSLESFYISNRPIRCIDFCEKRNELALGCSDNSIYLLDATTMEIRREVENAHENSVFVVRYSPDGKLLLSGGRDARLNAWSLENDMERIFTEPAHWYTINDIAFRPDGKMFATASRDKTLKVWETEGFQLLKVLEGRRDGGHSHSVNRLLWTNFNNWLVSCSDDRSIILWETDPD